MEFGNDYAGNIVSFGVKNSSSSDTDNRKNDFLMLAEGPTDDIRLSPSKKSFYLFQWEHFKNDEKCFSFHHLSSLCSQNIEFFLSWIFGHVEKTAWLKR